MNLPKISLLLGAITVVAGIGAYTIWGNLPDQVYKEDILLKDYEEFLQDLKNSETKNDLMGSCEKPEKFASKIKDLENRLSDLQKRKSDLIKEHKDAPPLPDISDSITLIPPEPEPYSPELFNGEYFNDVPPLPEISEDDIVVIPEPEPYSPELFNGEYFNDVPPLPEISEDDIIVIPEPEPYSPELFNGEYFNDVPPLPEISEDSIIDVFEQIDEIEKQIVKELNNLRTLCDEDEVISTSCPEACSKYSDCAGYTKGSTREDQKDAYNSCMEECAKWSEKTVICINKKPIKEPLDCMRLSFCALPEYGGPGIEVLQ